MESKIVKEPRTVPTMRHSSPISSPDSEERDLMNIFSSLSLKPSNLTARDAPWKREASSLMQPHLENSLVGSKHSLHVRSIL
ncbi:hypothetical protein ACE6H2_000550 [Prunus campanulata]